MGQDISKKNNFWFAWQALEMNNEGHFKIGIFLAKRLQRAIISQAKMSLLRNDIITLRKIRIYDMSCIYIERDIIQSRTYIGIMRKLGLLFQEIYYKKTCESKPFIVIGPPDKQKFCHISIISCYWSRNDIDAFLALTLNKIANIIDSKRQVDFDRSVLKIKYNEGVY